MDDRRFATSRAEALAARGYGDEGIRAFLEAEGAGAEAVEQALAALLPEVERARALVARHGASPRLAARLQRKGFGEDAVESAAGEGFADGDAET